MFRVPCFMTYRTLGVVLSRRDVHERDRLYTIYTAQYGRVEALAKGARKIQSKLAGAMEVPGIVDVLLARGAFFERLAGTQLTEFFTGIYGQPERLEHARAALLLTEHLTRPDIRDDRIFILLASYLRGLNAAEPPQFREFVLRLLSFLGFISMQEAAKSRAVLQETLPDHVPVALREFVIERL